MRTLSLLMLAFLYPAMLWAQTPARLSPSLSHEIKRGQSNQPWIITVTNIDSFRKNFKTDIIIQQEYRAVNSLRVLPQNSKAVQALISSNMLVFADLAQRKAKEELLVSGLDLGLNRVNRLHHFYPSLTGEGLMVSIKGLPLPPAAPMLPLWPPSRAARAIHFTRARALPGKQACSRPALPT
jgi:hypothetical protein